MQNTLKLMPHNLQKPSRGFTLLEMIVSMAVVAILAAIAVPSMFGLVLDNKVASANSDFVGALRYAKSEALSNGTSVSVRTTTAGDFSSWVVVVANGTVLRQHPATDPKIRLTVTGTGGSAVTNFTFDKHGMLSVPAPNTQVVVSATGRRNTFTVTVLQSGQVDVEEN